MSRPSVAVVGLGPAGPELITVQTAEALAATPHRFLRTRQHPSASAVVDAIACDDLYEQHDTFEKVYVAIAERLFAAAAQHGHIVYAVPGSPRVLERTVELLLADSRLDVEVMASMSFLDLAWERLGVDPVEAGVRIVDAHTFATSAAGARGPLLVAHCHNKRVLSDLRLAVDGPGDAKVTVVQRLGLDDEAIFEVPWADLDRSFEPDRLTSLYIPELEAPVAAELMRFQELVQTLRRECPWDSRQTHVSLRRHLIEESYEVLDAIDGFDPESGVGADGLEEELGDVLFQVFLHSVLASEAGWFDISDVARHVHDKLYDRHPHVFGGSEVSGVDELVISWEARKLVEKDRDSVLDGMATGLPSLALAEKTIKKASAIEAGLGADEAGVLQQRLAAVVEQPDEAAIGKALLALAALSQRVGVDPEMALRAEVQRVGERIRRFEVLRRVDASVEPGVLWTQSAD